MQERWERVSVHERWEGFQYMKDGRGYQYMEDGRGERVSVHERQTGTTGRGKPKDRTRSLTRYLSLPGNKANIAQITDGLVHNEQNFGTARCNVYG